MPAWQSALTCEISHENPANYLTANALLLFYAKGATLQQY